MVYKRWQSEYELQRNQGEFTSLLHLTIKTETFATLSNINIAQILCFIYLDLIKHDVNTADNVLISRWLIASFPLCVPFAS